MGDVGMVAHKQRKPTYMLLVVGKVKKEKVVGKENKRRSL
jgi:hypothetical protein